MLQGLLCMKQARVAAVRRLELQSGLPLAHAGVSSAMTEFTWEERPQLRSPPPLGSYSPPPNSTTLLATSEKTPRLSYLLRVTSLPSSGNRNPVVLLVALESSFRGVAGSVPKARFQRYSLHICQVRTRPAAVRVPFRLALRLLRLLRNSCVDCPAWPASLP